MLTKLHRDDLAEAVLINEGNCPHCWYRISDELAGLICDELLATCRDRVADDIDLGWVAQQIADALDADDAEDSA